MYGVQAYILSRGLIHSYYTSNTRKIVVKFGLCMSEMHRIRHEFDGADVKVVFFARFGAFLSRPKRLRSADETPQWKDVHIIYVMRQHNGIAIGDCTTIKIYYYSENDKSVKK